MKNIRLDILFVIVLFKIELKQSATYLFILNSLKENDFEADLVVYDNSPESVQNDFNGEDRLNIIYISDTANGGVSKAYNRGAEIALKMNKKWILLLDQDTKFPVQTISKYVSAIKLYPEEKLFAPVMLVNHNTIISPCYFKFMRGFSANHIDAGVNSLNKYSLINCGMCVNVASFIKNDGYNELIKLDFSDHDFIRRFKKNIAADFIVVDLAVEHSLSTSVKNSYTADKVRFNYYLEGARDISKSFSERFLVNIHCILRALKLSVLHKKTFFLMLTVKHIFLSNNGQGI